MEERSAALAAGDAPSSAFKQVTFASTSGCAEFVANPFKADKCRECQASLIAHHRCAVATEKEVLAAVEWLSKAPSVVLDAVAEDPARGPLLLGGFKAAMDGKLMQKQGVSHIVNAAAGLDRMWPQFAQAEQRNEQAGITILRMPWLDAEDQRVELGSLRDAARFIDRGLRGGGGVFVHCAQGRSRSTMAVLAYLCSRTDERPLSVDDALALVQERRIMAQPNASFMRQLKEFEALGQLSTLLSV